MNGGYLMVSKTDTNLYEKLNKALTIGKPVLWYEDENICYYIDTITKSGTDIILTKGGKTITIESDGDITEVGDIQNHLYLLSFYENEFNVAFLCDKDFSARTINLDNLTDEDKDYLKSIQGHILSNESLIGISDSSVTKEIIDGYYDGENVILNLVDFRVTLSLENPADTGEDNNVNISSKQLF